MEMHTEFIAD